MPNRKAISAALWVLQVFLALFFALVSGAPKLILPIDQIPMPIPLPAAFLAFIGVAEILGALGLVLPGLLRIRPGLTPLAAACLVLLTICATIYQLLGRQPESAVFAAGMGLLCAVVAYGRWRLVPLGRPARSAAVQAPA
ncbi:MAG: DoxX family protein [Dehalococcoidia bacterium]